MSPVAVPVSCIHCGKTFYGPRMSVAMIRDRGHLVQMQQFMQSLRKHLSGRSRIRSGSDHGRQRGIRHHDGALALPVK